MFFYEHRPAKENPRRALSFVISLALKQHGSLLDRT
jgi:hypothetical protein